MISQHIWNQESDARAYWDVCGTFGQLNGTVDRAPGQISCQNGTVSIICQYEKTAYGLYSRRDTVTNISRKPIRLTGLKARFLLDEGEHRVYTQFNNWQRESQGSWQDLVTAVSAASRNIRSAQTATPFLSLWNRQLNRGAAFHLLPFCSWEIRATRIAAKSPTNRILVELGVGDLDLDLELLPGESFSLPQILCYGFRNQTDMDCWKLHRYMHDHWPRKQLPMAFNSWMYRFDRFTYENLEAQIAPAKELGLEYFVIDAGWFGKGDRWVTSVGDWAENTTGGFYGRMKEFSDAVRTAGLKFGLWLEPERADPQSDAVRDHREFFFPHRDNYFLDFANPDARAWALELISGLIRRYGIEFIKFDLNADVCYDHQRTGFIRYFDGYLEFLRLLREAHPNLYLSGCSGGGGRMHLAGCTVYDGYWPSDNESPYAEMRIFKDTLLRMPPQAYENWAVIKSAPRFSPHYDSGDYADKLIACNDAVWNDVAGVQMSFLKGYLTGGPACFSCDLTALTPAVRQELAKHIAWLKKNRDFWLKAEGRILTDTPSMLVLQYADAKLEKLLIQAFKLDAWQDRILVFPAVASGRSYRLSDGTVLSAETIQEEGIPLLLPEGKEMIQLELTAL